MTETTLAFENREQLETAIQERMGWTREEMDKLLAFAEKENKLVVKEREWLGPAYGGPKLAEFMLECGATCDKRRPMKKVYYVERRKVEDSLSRPITKSSSELKEPQPAKPTSMTVKLTQLQFGVFSPRKTNTKWVQHLLEAIEAEGVENFPLPKARIHPDSHKMSEVRYQLVDGEHFCRALQKLNVKTVKIEVFTLTDQEADYKAMRFNQIHGKLLEPIEEARHLKKMMDKYNLSQQQIAKKFIRSQSWVSKRLAMLELPETDVTTRVVTSTHAEEIVKVSEDVRPRIIEKVETEELATRPTHELVQNLKETPKKKTEILAAPYDPLGVECEKCGMGTHFPLIRNGKKVCSKCADEIDEDPRLLKELEKPVPLKRKTETQEYKPTWAERKEQMHPKKSKMELEVIQELQAEGWPIDTDYWIPLTKPDGYLHEIRLPLEVDGEQVHKGKKAERDEIVNSILKHRGMEPAREHFSRYSVKRKEEIKASFRKHMIQRYRKKGLKLPLPIQEKMGENNDPTSRD